MTKLKLFALSAGLALVACTAEQTQEGELPEISIDSGQLPKYDVDPANVEINRDTTRVVTPDIDIVPDTTKRD